MNIGGRRVWSAWFEYPRPAQETGDFTCRLRGVWRCGDSQMTSMRNHPMINKIVFGVNCFFGKSFCSHASAVNCMRLLCRSCFTHVWQAQ